MPLNPEHDKFLRSTVQEMLDNDISEQDIYKVRDAWLQKWNYDETAGTYKNQPSARYGNFGKPKPTIPLEGTIGLQEGADTTPRTVPPQPAMPSILESITNLANRAVQGPLGTIGSSMKEAVTVPLSGAASFFPSGILGGEETQLGRDVAEVMTDQPTTKAGELSGRILGFPFELLHRGSQKAGEVIEQSILQDPVLSGTATLRGKPILSVPKTTLSKIAGGARFAGETGLEFGGMMALGKLGKMAEAMPPARLCPRLHKVADCWSLVPPCRLM